MTDTLKKFLFISLLIFVSCKSHVGKIELRQNVKLQYPIFTNGNTKEPIEELKDSEDAYLVNTSFTNSYQFTVKEISIIDDTVLEYKTYKIILDPGDEEFIGRTKFLIGKKFSETIVPDTLFSNQKVEIDSLYEYKNSTFTASEVANAAKKNNLSFNDFIVKYNIKKKFLSRNKPGTLSFREIFNRLPEIVIDSTTELKRKTIHRKFECTGESLIKDFKKNK